MRSLLFILILPLFFHSAAHGSLCGDTTASGRANHEQLPRLMLSSRHFKAASPLEQHYADMFEALNLLPQEMELPYSATTLALGTYRNQQDIQSSVDKISKSLMGNVTLRALGLLCSKAAADSGAPQHAGDLFLTLLNRPRMTLKTVNGRPGIDIEGADVYEYLSQLGTMVFPSLATIRDRASETISSTTLLGFTHYSKFLSGEITPESMLRDNFLSALAHTGYSSSEPPTFSPSQAAGIVANGSSRISWNWTLTESKAVPMMILPSFQNLQAMPLRWAAMAYTDGREFLGVLALEKETALDLTVRLRLIEQVLHPLFVKDGAYEIASAAEANFEQHSVLFIPKHSWLFGSLLQSGSPTTFSNDREKLLGALAQVQKSAMFLSPRNQTGNLMFSICHLFNLSPELKINFLDLQIAARHYNFPIQYLANPEQSLKHMRSWVGAQRTENKRAPAYTLYPVVKDPQKASFLLQRWGSSPEKNDELLRDKTGIFVVVDPSTN